MLSLAPLSLEAALDQLERTIARVHNCAPTNKTALEALRLRVVAQAHVVVEARRAARVAAQVKPRRRRRS